MLHDHKFIVFALEHYNLLGMIKSLGCMGISPIYISVRRRYEIANKSKYISRFHNVYAPEPFKEVYSNFEKFK